MLVRMQRPCHLTCVPFHLTCLNHLLCMQAKVQHILGFLHLGNRTRPFSRQASDEWVWKWKLLAHLGSGFSVHKHPVTLGEMLTLKVQAFPTECHPRQCRWEFKTGEVDVLWY